MFSESKELEKQDIEEQGKEKLAELLPLLEQLAKELQSRFPVGKDCRIQTQEFEDVFSLEEIKKDQKRVESLEKKFSEKNIGELLEVIKTLTFNQLWFSNDLISLRTSKFDDYCNGVDEVVIDIKTNEVLAAIDETTNPQQKIKELQEKITQGSKVKYGVSLVDHEIQKGSLKNLPTFVVSLKPEELIILANNLLKENDTQDMERKVIEDLLKQSRAFQEITFGIINERYKKAEEIFQRINLGLK